MYLLLNYIYEKSENLLSVCQYPFTFSIIKAQNTSFRFAVSFEAIPNLTYQMDCITDFTYCQKRDYQKLWDDEFLKSAKDHKLLEDWRIIRGRYTKEIEMETDTEFPILARMNFLNSADKIQIAGFQAKNIEDYLTRLDLLVLPKERERFEKVVRHFEARFLNWWEKEANQKGQIFAAKTKELLNSEKIKNEIAKFYDFYQPTLPENYTVNFNLFYRPNLVKTGSSGRAMENHLLVEFLADEHPAQRIDVVLHEFCHFLYSSVSDEDYSQLQKKFLQTKKQTAVPAFNLLNESLATAFGNGIIARLFTPTDEWEKYIAAKGSFYNNPHIDQAAKELLPFLENWLVKGGKLNDEKFVEVYLNTLETKFGASLISPKLFLNQTYLFLDEKFDSSIQNNFRRNLMAQSFFVEQSEFSKTEFTYYFANPNLSSTFIIFPQTVKYLTKSKVISTKAFKEINKIAKTKKNFLFSIKRNENAYIFIIVAENSENAILLSKELSEAPKIFIGKFIKL